MPPAMHRGFTLPPNARPTTVRLLARQIGATPIAEVTSEACESAILAAKHRAAARQGSTDGSGAARRYFQVPQHLFTWARKTPAYKQQGLLTNPMDDLDSAETAGKATRRQRTLNDAELAAVWQAADVMGTYGRLVQLLVLTGARRNKLSETRWPEIDLSKKLIVIPAARMKMDQAHTIPLAPMAFEILATLQRERFDCVFSANDGRTSFTGFARSKKKLDQLSGVSGFVIHDNRRTMRSRLSALDIQEVVREAMIAHRPKGIQGVYNVYQ
jgi:integrase